MSPAAAHYALKPQPGLVRKPGPRGGRGHWYLNGRVCSGVTTATSVIEKPALKGWAAEMGANHVRDQLSGYIEQGLPIPASIFEKALDGAKYAFKDASTRAKARGTKVDGWINDHIAARIVARQTGQPFKGPAMPSHVEEPEAVRSINAFLEWEGENEVDFIGFQHAAADPTYCIVGVSDWWAVVGKKGVRRFWIADTKASKGATVYDEWQLQISANLTVAALGGTIEGLAPPKPGADLAAFNRQVDEHVGRAVLIADKLTGEPHFVPVETDRQNDWENVLRAAGLRQRIPQTWG